MSGTHKRYLFLFTIILFFSMGALGGTAPPRTSVEVTLTALTHTYDGTQKDARCETIPAGVRTSLTYRSAGSGTDRVNAGNYWVTCSVTEPGKTGQANGQLTIMSAEQTIAFAPIDDKDAGDPPFDLVASASSGLPVGFTSNTPDVCSVAGITVSLLQAGSCTITANQDGNLNYLPAPKTGQCARQAPHLTHCMAEQKSGSAARERRWAGGSKAGRPS